MLHYLGLSDPEIAVTQVRQRVAKGGHNIPEDVVRRRFSRSKLMFESTYRDIVHHWLLCDVDGDEPLLVSEGKGKH